MKSSGTLVLAAFTVCDLFRRNGAHDVRPDVLRVHATARSIHIQLRVAVLRSPPRPESLRSASAAKQTAHGTLVAFGGTTFVFLRARRPATTHRAASSRRLRARPIPRCIVAGIPASSPRGRSARASAEPSPPNGLLQSASSSKPPAPQQRRVFLCSILRVVVFRRRRLAILEALDRSRCSLT